MKKIITGRCILALIGVFLTSAMWAQNKRASPPATAGGNVNGANINIDYSSPAVKGRKIWGELVPYDKVWRVGANEATLITIDKDVQVGAKALSATKYSVYAIPGK